MQKIPLLFGSATPTHVRAAKNNETKLNDSKMVYANAVANLLVSNDAYLAGSTCKHLWKNFTCLSLL